MRATTIIDVEGLTIGHATDFALGTGVTAILFDEPAIAGACLLGGAPALRDTALLAPGMTVERIDAVVLSGGSAFGLDAAGGVQSVLRAAGRGIAVGAARIPIVVQASLFDLGLGIAWTGDAPFHALGAAAARAASREPPAEGSVGAGTGATTATVKGGIGTASQRLASGHTVGAMVAVNALGSPLIGEGPWFWSAPFERDGEFGGLGWPSPWPADALQLRLKGAPTRPGAGQRNAGQTGAGQTNAGQTNAGETNAGQTPSTTIGLVATDAALDRRQAHRLAIAAQDGLARAILPAHAAFDGDMVFAAATATRPAVDDAGLAALCHAATLVFARAIARGVHAATRLPGREGPPDWRGLHDRAATRPGKTR